MSLYHRYSQLNTKNKIFFHKKPPCFDILFLPAYNTDIVGKDYILFMKKIAFFDIDGTLTSEIDGSVPDSAVFAIRKARENGNLMFLNTGRCLQNIEQRFREIGFDGYICGCGTNIYCNGQDILYVPQTHSVTMQILQAAQSVGVDILFESRKEVCFDTSRPLSHPNAIKQYEAFVSRDYNMPVDLENPNFFCDKFVIWYQEEEQLTAFRKVSDIYFTCIDRGGTFREFVPHGYSKASGIQYVLKHYSLSLEDAYAFGDSNNDLPMLTFVKNSVAMGNSSPASLCSQVLYVTSKASEDGIFNALKHFHFF